MSSSQRPSSILQNQAVERVSKPATQFDQISYLMIEPNSQCNLKCLSCTREELARAGQRKAKNITLEELQYILDQLKNSPIDTVKVEGLSEPFLHPQLLSVVQTIKSYFQEAHLILISNLQYKIERTEIIKILDLVGALYISVDGVARTYETLRPPAKWDLMLKNLKWLSQQTSESQKKKIYLNFTASPENYRELVQVKELNQQLGFSEVRVNLIQDWREQQRNKVIFNEDMIQFLRLHKENIKGVTPWEYKDCFWPFNGVVIDVEGQVRQCVLNTTQQPLGNIFQSSLKEIFNNNPILQKVRSELQQNKCAESCATCDYSHLSPVLKKLFESESQARPRTKVVVK